MTPEGRRALRLALAAALAWGGWAALANAGHGAGAALRAGLAQAAASFAATLGSSMLLEALFSLPGRALARVLVASFGTQAVVLLVLLAGHSLAGTPEIARTLAPVAAVGLAYFPSYAAALLRAERRRDGTREAARECAGQGPESATEVGIGRSWLRLAGSGRSRASARASGAVSLDSGEAVVK